MVDTHVRILQGQRLYVLFPSSFTFIMQRSPGQDLSAALSESETVILGLRNLSACLPVSLASHDFLHLSVMKSLTSNF